VRRRRQRGFSLAEVLGAMTLFALVASAIGAIAATSMRHTAQNRHATVAAMLAQRELEDLRGLDYDDVVSRASTSTEEGLAYAIDTVVLDDTPAAGMKRITVGVSWTGPLGSRSYAVHTIFTSIR
jgi:type II secretory pathway pseudopilin PulG